MPTGTAQVRRLYEKRIGKRPLDEADSAPGIGAPVVAEKRDIRRLLQACGSKEALHRVLSMAAEEPRTPEPT